MKITKFLITIFLFALFTCALTLTCFAGEEIVKLSGDIEIQKDEIIDGDVVAMLGDIKIYGTVKGNVTAFKGNIHLEENAIIEGDVVTFAGEIYKSPDSQITGKITEIRHEGINALTNEHEKSYQEVRYIERKSDWGHIFFQILGFGALTLLGLSLFGNSINSMNLWIKGNLGSVILKGLLGWLAFPFLVLALIVTILGIPIAILSLLLTPIPFIVGLWVLGLFTGEKIIPLIKKDWEKNNILEGTLGAIIILLAAKAPFIGFIMFPATAILGLGIILDSKFGTGKPWFNNKGGNIDEK